MPLIHKRGSLFDAPEGSVLVHSCNGQGDWGAGIALQLKDRFPSSYDAYATKCQCTDWFKLCGDAYATREYANTKDKKLESHWVASLFVSRYYGKYRASPRAILDATRLAVSALLNPERWHRHWPPTFHSPRLNTGHFGVPWEQTEAEIRPLIDAAGVEWTVWTP